MSVETTPALDVIHLSVNFENGSGELQALEDVTFRVWPQEFVCLLGPSGSGKSTLLRVLAGLVPPTQGEIRFAGGRTPRIGYVFQQANLMPWRTVLENIMLPLELQGVPPDEARRQAQAWVERVGLNGFESAWPRDLSGAWHSALPLHGR